MFITLEQAVAHLRAETDDPRLQAMLDGAERSVIEALDRNVYADSSALAAAIAAAPATLATAKTAYDVAMTAAEALDDADLQASAELYAESAWRAAQAASDRTQYGIVVNADIKAAILLQLQHLFDGADTVSAVASLVQPHRRLGL